jgi:uncharacterized lipoprotein NlpE involved in copper resistance
MNSRKTTMIFVSILLLISCNNRNKSKEIDPVLDNVKHVYGVYEGILPAASSEGIWKQLIINENQTYEMRYVYLGVVPEDTTDGNFAPDTFLNKGNFKIENGDLILDITNEPSIYKIHNNSIEQLDMEGNVILSEFSYELKKKE